MQINHITTKKSGKPTKISAIECLAVSVLCAMLALIASCSNNNAEQPNKADTGSTVIDRRDSLALPVPEIVEVLELPDALAEYRPEHTIAPIVPSSVMRSFRYIHAEDNLPHFIYVNNSEPVSLPAQAKYHHAVMNWAFESDDFSTSCFLLYDDEFNIAILHLDGTIASNEFVYKLADDGEDGIYVMSQGGYIKAYTEIDGARKYGVLSIETGEPATDFEYDNIMFYDRFIAAHTGDNVTLLSYDGDALRSFENAIVHFTTSGIYLMGDKVPDGKSEYILNHDTGAVYQAVQEIEFFLPYDNFDVVTGPDNLKSVYSKSGQHLYSLHCYNHYDKGDFMLMEEISSGASGRNFGDRIALVRIESDGTIYSTPEATAIHHILFLEWDGEAYTVIGYSGATANSDILRIRVSGAGEVLAEEIIDTEEAYAGRFDSSTNNIRFKDSQVAYFDNEGNEVIAFGKYENLDKFGPFVIAQNGFGSNPKIDIYNSKGELLVEDAYFCIPAKQYGLPSDEEMIVYKDSKDCGWLTADGAYTPIPNTLEVVRVVRETGM
ncbi:MAG: hypothetical protein FWG30_01775 [Eubacteriaceae bacterium]|nr:hypothetical protein [Eubacteriaceae bacterium]